MIKCRTALLTMVMGMTSLLGCGLETGERGDSEGSPETATASENVGSVSSALEACPADVICEDFSDVTGSIHTRIYRCPWSDEAPTHSRICTVGSEHVLVGGGVEVISDPASAGTLLSANINWGDSWWAKTVSHISNSPHLMRVYAIGLRLKRGNGVFLTKAQLASSVVVTEADNVSTVSQPTVSAVIPAQHTLVGGGAYTHTGKQFLWSSRPDATAWLAGGKDHIVASPGGVLARAISIKTCPDHWDHCLSTWFQLGSKESPSGYHYASNGEQPSRVLTSVGGAATWTQGWGRMLVDMVPSGLTSYVSSKDHIRADSGHTFIWSIGLTRIN